MNQLERLTLTAQVGWEDARFIARVEGLDVTGEGDSPEKAQEELVQAMLTWISNQDCTEGMADALSGAGYPAISDETELELEFADLPAPSGSRPFSPEADHSIDENGEND